MEMLPNPETKPTSSRPFFKATFIRHAEPYYNEIGHDLTPNGVDQAKNIGRQLKKEGRIAKEDDLILLHSPQARTRGTLEFIADEAGIPHDSKRKIDQIRRSDLNDFEAFMKRVQELDSNPEAIAEDHYKNPLYEDRPDIIEPSSLKKKRLYRSLEYLIRFMDKRKENSTLTPHVIAVSHFEIITHLLDDVFGIENVGKYDAPSFGEVVELDAFKTGSSDKVLLEISYNNKSKNVNFNRKDRSIEEVE